jgi:hypothetical protein
MNLDWIQIQIRNTDLDFEFGSSISQGCECERREIIGERWGLKRED